MEGGKRIVVPKEALGAAYGFPADSNPSTASDSHSMDGPSSRSTNDVVPSIARIPAVVIDDAGRQVDVNAPIGWFDQAAVPVRATGGTVEGHRATERAAGSKASSMLDS